MEAITLHWRLDVPQLSPVKWCALRLLRTVLDPFMYVQMKLDSNKVT